MRPIRATIVAWPPLGERLLAWCIPIALATVVSFSVGLAVLGVMSLFR